ncbi:MAG TPA: hypothetical protein PLE79_02020 [Clostridia bacterium]|nr:hypothetical protein [Clostridia bacterium]
MKKAALALIGLLLVFCLCSCIKIVDMRETPISSPAETEAQLLPSPTPELATPKPIAAPSLAPELHELNKGLKMYSSYAYLKNFDPLTGLAMFDYFDLLQGKDAIDYLVKHEGYPQAKAEAEVNNFADSEFIEKNTNTALRAVNIDEVSLNLMYQPSGEPAETAASIPSTADDFRAIYAHDRSLLLESYFYYIHVNAYGMVFWVEQVYWP